jgi:MFS family permease
MPARTSPRPSYAYLIVAICFCIQALGIGVYIAFGVFFNPLMEEFGWSRAAISGASSIAFFSMGLFGVMVGRLNDRLGPRPIMSVTAILLGLGCVLMAQFLRRDPGKLSDRRSESPASNDDTLESATNDGLPLSQSLKTIQLRTICLVNFLLVFCLMIIMLHIVPHARDLGVSPIRSAGVLSVIGAVSMVGRFISGLVIDYRDSKTVMGACFLLLIVSLGWLQLAQKLWMLYLFAGVYGLAHGGFFKRTTGLSPINYRKKFGLYPNLIS